MVHVIQAAPWLGTDYAAAIPDMKRRAEWLASPGGASTGQKSSAARSSTAWDDTRRGSRHSGGTPQAGRGARRAISHVERRAALFSPLAGCRARCGRPRSRTARGLVHVTGAAERAASVGLRSSSLVSFRRRPCGPCAERIFNFLALYGARNRSRDRGDARRARAERAVAATDEGRLAAWLSSPSSRSYGPGAECAASLPGVGWRLACLALPGCCRSGPDIERVAAVPGV